MMVRMLVENRGEPRSSKDCEAGGQWSKMPKKHGRQERGVTIVSSSCTGPRQTGGRQQLSSCHAVRPEALGRTQSTIWQSAIIKFRSSAPRSRGTQAMPASCTTAAAAAAQSTTTAVAASVQDACGDDTDQPVHSAGSDDEPVHTINGTHEQQPYMPDTVPFQLQPSDMVSSCDTLIQTCLSEHEAPDSAISTAEDCDSGNTSAPTEEHDDTAAYLSGTSFILDKLISEMSQHESMLDGEVFKGEGPSPPEDAVAGLDWEMVRALHDDEEVEIDEDEYVML